MDTNDILQNVEGLSFDSPQNQSSYIKVIGVGGGGNNAVNHMFRQGIAGVDFIVCNTDRKALNTSPVPNKIMLGNGMGAGNNPEVARAAAEAKSDEIRSVLSDSTKMLFIAAGMGGGTGTGAAPVIAKLAKEITLEDGYTNKILVVAIVTMPFFFEGMKRMKQALAGLEELRSHVDSVLVINNDKLLRKGNLPLPSAYALADDVLLTAAKGISELITVNSYINIDFEDVNTVMAGSGTALMGIGVGKGENRANDAIAMATTSELLNDNDISGAKDILLYITSSVEKVISVDELSEITDYITRLTGSTDTNVIWGQGTDDSLEDEIKITLIATGFEAKKNDSIENKDQRVDHETTKENMVAPTDGGKDQDSPRTGTIFPLDETRPVENMDRVPEAVTWTFPRTEQVPESADDGMTLIHRDQPAVNVISSNDSSYMRSSHSEEKEAIVLDESPAVRVVDSETPKSVEEKESVMRTSMTESRQVETTIQSQEIKTTAEERIKRMHDLLRHNPMGAEIAENMSTEELMDGYVPAGPLSESDMPSTYLGQGGRVFKQDGYLDNAAD